MAILVPKIIALETPCKTLKTRKKVMVCAKTMQAVVMVKRISPDIKIFFLPSISPSLPKGRRKTAVPRR
jgi:hypothetical protein